MALNGSTVLVAGTCSATAGTSKVYTLNGQNIKNGVQVIDASETNALIRSSMTFRSVDGQYDANAKKFSQDRREVTITRPRILTDGSLDFPSIRIIYTGNREITPTELDILYSQAAQVMFDSDFEAFRKSGSIA